MKWMKNEHENETILSMISFNCFWFDTKILPDLHAARFIDNNNVQCLNGIFFCIWIFPACDKYPFRSGVQFEISSVKYSNEIKCGKISRNTKNTGNAFDKQITDLLLERNSSRASFDYRTSVRRTVSKVKLLLGWK